MPAITDLPIWTNEGFEIRTQGVTDTTPTTYTYAGQMGNYVFRNDGGVNLTLTINGSAVTVATGQMVTGNTFSSFTVQASSGSVSWTMRAFQESPMNISQSASSNMSSLLTFQSGATALGNGTAVDVSGYSTLSLDVIISATATVSFEVSNDGTTYSLLPYYYPNSPSNTNLNVTVRGLRFNVAGYKWFRARISSYTSGTVDVTGYASTTQIFIPYSTATFGNSDSNSATQGGLLGVGAYNLIFDGTNWARQRSATAAGDGNSSTGLATTTLMAFNGTTWDRVRSVNTGQLKTTLYNSSGTELYYVAPSSIADNATLNAGAGIMVSSLNIGFNGSTFDRQRVGKVYKYIEFVAFTSTMTQAVWTPATGKKFRVMGISISCGAACSFKIQDASTTFHQVRSSGANTFTFDFGNGYLSSAANNVLNVYNDSGATVAVNVTAWGTEE